MQAASAGTSVADDARTMHAPGHAGVLASRLTQTGALLGTPAYMSPEQHRGERADARSDQFSFAVALFEALHGRRPFAGETLPSLVRAVLEGEIVAVETKEVPPSVETALRRALAVSPEDRHADLRALLDTLRREWEASARPRGDAPQERRSRGDRDAELDATPDTMPPPRDPALARRRLAAAGFVALATILAVAWGLTRRPPRPPEDAGTTAAAERARSSGMSDEEAHRELVAALLASTPDARARLAATYLERFGEGDEVAGGRARGFIASSLIASSAWDGACARPEDGLCVQWDEIPQGEETCAVGGTRRLRVVERDPAESKAGRELAERLVGAVATITPPSDDLEASAFAEAQAKMSLLVLDARLEAMFTTWQGETLTGGAAVERLGQDALSGLDELTGAYESLGEATASYWGVLAWARAGFAREQFMAVHESATLPAEVLEAMSAWDSTASISSPKRHHCNGLAEQLAGLRGQAAGAFATCSTLATKVGVSRGIVRVCDERMQALSSVDVPTLRKTIKGALPAVRACYDGELGEAPELAGRIEVRFVVGADGAVLHARSTEDSDLPVSMQRCVEGVIQGLHFPAPGGRGSVVQYPFVFGPG
jgi:hypothetical protein